MKTPHGFTLEALTGPYVGHRGDCFVHMGWDGDTTVEVGDQVLHLTLDELRDLQRLTMHAVECRGMVVPRLDDGRQAALFEEKSGRRYVPVQSAGTGVSAPVGTSRKTSAPSVGGPPPASVE